MPVVPSSGKGAETEAGGHTADDLNLEECL